MRVTPTNEITRSESTESCARSVMEAVPLVMRFLRTEMRRHRSPKLSVPQLRALAFVDRHPGACLSEVADHLGVARPTASAIVDRLVQRGLLARAADPHERRRMALTLTPEGAQQLEEARRATRVEIEKILAALPEATLQRIVTGLGLLSAAFTGAKVDGRSRLQ